MSPLGCGFNRSTQSIVEEPPAPPDVIVEQEPWLTEGVQHALNCTHADYRNEHYDECVLEPSEIYPKPEANPDDIGFIASEDLVLYASLKGAGVHGASDPQ